MKYRKAGILAAVFTIAVLAAGCNSNHSSNHHHMGAAASAAATSQVGTAVKSDLQTCLTQHPVSGVASFQVFLKCAKVPRKTWPVIESCGTQVIIADHMATKAERAKVETGVLKCVEEHK